MRLQPRQYQKVAADDALRFLRNAAPGARRLYAAPTGTGKSVMELAVLEGDAEAWCVTPRVEIMRGMLDKLGLPADDMSEDEVHSYGERERIITPTRLRNRLLAGVMGAPGRLVVDEAHHDIATTYQQVHALCGRAPAVGFTATPFRGTPKGTTAFREEWGDPVWVLTLKEAVACGALSFPTVKMLPLVDDDQIEVRNGEFAVKACEEAVTERLGAAAAWAAANLCCMQGFLDMPTMACLPGTESCHSFVAALKANGVQAFAVTGKSSFEHRKLAFASCLRRESVLVQVYVVSEGVDLPVRRLLDLSPMISPVRFLQQFGRITRPGGVPEYVCTNRNLLRHAYLLDGALPGHSLKEAQSSFPAPACGRAALRVIGLEAIGRLRAVELPLSSGLTGLMYCVSAVLGHRVTEYAALVHPARAEVVWATRTNFREGGTTAQYGRWARCEAPDGLEGYASINGSPVTEKQAAWWKKSAERHGLASGVKVNRRQFAALPVLSDLRSSL